jgi:Fe-S cluster assembly scaffold protein SufB
MEMKHVDVPAGTDAGLIQLENRWLAEDALKVELGEGARAVVIEGCTSPRAQGARRARIDVSVGKGAHLKLIILQALPRTVDNEVLVRADGGRIIDISLGGRKITRRFELGPAAELLAVGRAPKVSGGRHHLWELPYVPPAEPLAFLRARGLGEKEAGRLLLSGWLAPVLEELPLEFSVELERLLDLYDS